MTTKRFYLIVLSFWTSPASWGIPKPPQRFRFPSARFSYRFGTALTALRRAPRIRPEFPRGFRTRDASTPVPFPGQFEPNLSAGQTTHVVPESTSPWTGFPDFHRESI